MYDEAAVVLEFLPPYSPDYNPIEMAFGVLKQWVKRYINQAQDFENFGLFLSYAVESSGADSHGPAHFSHCGYIANPPSP